MLVVQHSLKETSLVSSMLAISLTQSPLLSHTHRYNGYYFASAMLYAVFLGFLGVDRFCMGYTCLGLAKLFTLGCLGVWWVVDVILLMTGSFTPNDDFSWEQYY